MSPSTISSKYNCFNNKGIKHITRLSLGLSHLRDNKFKHGFLDSLNPTCRCGLDTETTCHYLLHCPSFTNERSVLLDIVSRINKNSLASCGDTIVKFLLNSLSANPTKCQRHSNNSSAAVNKLFEFV